MSTLITEATALRICFAYREIKVGKELLANVEKELRDNGGKMADFRDSFGRRRELQLGLPCGENAHRLFDVPPHLACSVIRAHIAAKEKELVEANESARIELTAPSPDPAPAGAQSPVTAAH